MQFRERLRQILVIRDSPRRIGMAFALGIFIGMSPLLGLHTVLGLILAWAFGLNRFVTLAGVFVTNPWTIVPIYTFGTWIGARMLGVHDIVPDIDWNHISVSGLLGEFSHLLMPFVLGTTVLGMVSSVAGYFLIVRAVKSARG